MTYNIVKLIGVLVLAALTLVLVAVGSLDSAQGFAVVGTLVGYVVGNAQVTGNSPIVKKGDK